MSYDAPAFCDDRYEDPETKDVFAGDVIAWEVQLTDQAGRPLALDGVRVRAMIVQQGVELLDMLGTVTGGQDDPHAAGAFPGTVSSDLAGKPALRLQVRLVGESGYDTLFDVRLRVRAAPSFRPADGIDITAPDDSATRFTQNRGSGRWIVSQRGARGYSPGEYVKLARPDEIESTAPEGFAEWARKPAIEAAAAGAQQIGDALTEFGEVGLQALAELDAVKEATEAERIETAGVRASTIVARDLALGAAGSLDAVVVARDQTFTARDVTLVKAAEVDGKLISLTPVGPTILGGFVVPPAAGQLEAYSPFYILGNADGTTRIVNDDVDRIRGETVALRKIAPSIVAPDVAGIVDGVGIADPSDPTIFYPLNAVSHDGKMHGPLFSGPTPRIVLGPKLFAVGGRNITLFGPSMLPYRNRGLGYEFTLLSQNEASQPLARSFVTSIDVAADRLGSSAILKLVSRSIDAFEFSLPLTIVKSAASKTGSPACLMIGDSITQGTQQTAADMMAATALTPTWIGSRRRAGTTAYGEGRGGWRAADFVYQFTKFAPLPAGQEGFVRFDGTDGRNPFIRAATGSDNAAFVKNGYIFDFRYYLDRFGFPNPATVSIELGVNDMLNDGLTNGVANAIAAIAIMVAQIKAAAPACRIGLAVPMVGSNAQYDRYWDQGLTPLLLDHLSRYAADPQVDIINTHAATPDRLVHAGDVHETDAVTGQTKDWPVDRLHATSTPIGSALYAEQIFAFHHARS